MSRFNLIFATILICIASAFCDIFEGYKKGNSFYSSSDISREAKEMLIMLVFGRDVKGGER